MWPYGKGCEMVRVRVRPYGKGCEMRPIALTLTLTTDPNPDSHPRCDMWSIGVLLYVMLSKTMPFRAKEVDQLLKQVRHLVITPLVLGRPAAQAGTHLHTP